ncbi:peptidase M61 [Aquimarina sp. ERC-38]|uniref:M61 family metallopeptidase n=1 Tax=Aquimarina sp. ERC-38 TaxID=2949996 RepID=UPI002245D275|nr:peptidase M61 [Aquimarina sp. ERC-38]UZO79699.1 peptidase M61 [Aquimarina sp. ERC-38]
MKNLFYTVLSAILLVSCGGLKTDVNLASESPIFTTLDLTKTEDDKVAVIINPGKVLRDTLTYRIPKVVQGTYAISDFGRFLENVKALDYKGNNMPLRKMDDNTWVITNAKKFDKLTYQVNDTYDLEKGDKNMPFSPSGTNIEPTNVVLNLHGFIGYFEELKNVPYGVEVIAPKNYKRSASLSLLNREEVPENNTVVDRYLANRYFEITDNPMMYGDLDIEVFTVGDIKITLSVYSPNKLHTAASIKETVFKMMKAQKAYLGDIDSTPRYDIYLYLAPGELTAPKGFGALEHHTSTVVVLPEAIPEEALASAMVDVVSHEFFHIVTPLSVHSEDVHYFNYNEPTFSKHLWMYEGVTEYFATLFQVHQGLVGEAEFYQKIAGKILASKRYDDSMSFTVMSENVIEKEYQDNYANVYEKGALIGMCIDLLLREESEGKKGILSLMKELSKTYGKENPFEDDKIIEEIVAKTYPSIGEFLNKHVIGTTPIDYSEFLTKVGLEFKEMQVPTSYIQNGSTLIVGGDPVSNTVFFNEEVTNNSFWNAQKVMPDDVIKSVNGTEINIANANQVLSQIAGWQTDQEVRVVLSRNDEEIIIDTKLTPSTTKAKSIAPQENASQEQLTLRKAWLTGS